MCSITSAFSYQFFLNPEIVLINRASTNLGWIRFFSLDTTYYILFKDEFDDRGMVFQNESTFQKFVNEGNEKLFNKKYEQAARSVRSEFGNTYSLIIAGKEVFATKSIAHRSPIDRRTILGYVQMATPCTSTKLLKPQRMHLRHGVPQITSTEYKSLEKLQILSESENLN